MTTKQLLLVATAFLLPSATLAMEPQLNLPPESTGSVAHRISPEDVPEALQPWIGWALNDTRADLCPFLNGDSPDTICQWASPLSLDLSDSGGTFSIVWENFEEGLVPLPGDEEHWPQEVKANGVPIPVLSSKDEGTPQVQIPRGTFNISGTFLWSRLPESLLIAPEAGVVQLSIRGNKIDFPNRHDDGSLWLEPKEEAAAEGDSATVQVYRHVRDSVPLIMTTEVDLEVSGAPREIIVPQVSLKNFTPLSLDTALPAQIESNGTLRIQAKAGSWHLRIKSRHQGPINEIMREAIPATPGEESPDEIWVFEAQNDLRLVTPEGVPSVDPSQTTLPSEWKRFPAFLVAPGATLKLVESRRGQAGLAPDDLKLHRDLWLDFDGRGYTFRDTLTGTIRESWRLEMPLPIELGQVTLNGDDQLITTLDPASGRSGIEIRQGSLNGIADSRLQKGRMNVPFPGWDHPFQQVSASLHLPPGWSLMTVLGADQVSSSWLNHWTLFDIFLVVVFSLAIGHLWGIPWGILSLVTLTLTFPEPLSPRWEWLPLLATCGLLPLVRKDRPARILRGFRLASLVLLILVSLPYMVSELRHGIYPTLEPLKLQVPGGNLMPAVTSTGGTAYEQNVAEEAPAPSPMQAQSLLPPPSKMAMLDEMRGEKEGISDRPSMKKKLLLKKNDVLPGANIQTGPGLPRWHWQDISISWLGPVDQGHKIRVFLVSPLMNLLLSLLRVLLLARLLLLLFNRPGENLWSPGRWIRPAAAAVLALMLLAPMQARAEAAYPTPEILDELREQLTATPACFPDCASIHRMVIESTPAVLRLRLEVGAAAKTAVPLPGSARDWMPDHISLTGGDKKDSDPGRVYRDSGGTLWAQVPYGISQVLLEGPLPRKNTVQLPLPLKPHRISTQLSGWSVSGINKEGLPEEAIQLHREESSSAESPSSTGLPAPNLPPLLEVRRQIVASLKWEVVTTVRRLSPATDSVVLKVPLLTGESVITPGIHVDQGSVSVNLPPQDEEFSWRSNLLETDKLTLKASEDASLVEQWELNASTLYHIGLEGIPMVHRSAASGSWLPEWSPWPGETVTISFSKPQAIPGATQTLEEASLRLTPGLRYTEALLHLEIRSSLGGQHAIQLPSHVTLQTVSVNGSEIPLSLSEDKLTLPISPGIQNFDIRWQQPTGLRSFFRPPAVNLGLPYVNATITVDMPPKRWILATHGPRLGPAVLFWGYVLVLLLSSIALGRLSRGPENLLPLKTYQWFLLGLGLSQVPFWASFIIAGWFLLFGWRKKHTRTTANGFNLCQMFLALWTVFAVLCLVWSIQQGLLGFPDMQIEGNQSTTDFLQWYQDRGNNLLPRPWLISLPLAGYRIAMLAWALWLAFRVLKWIKWGWECYVTNGAWQSQKKT